MNLINVIQMKTQSFLLTALLKVMRFSTVNTNAAEKLMAGTGKVNITRLIPAIRFTIHSMHELLFLKRSFAYCFRL